MLRKSKWLLMSLGLLVACTDAPADKPDMKMPVQDMGPKDMAPDVKSDMGPVEDMKSDMKPDVDMSKDMASDMEEDAEMDMARDMPADQTPDMVADMEADMEEDMSTPPITGADTCMDAPDITSGGVFMGLTTIGLADDYKAERGEDNCPNGSLSGPDAAFLLQPQSDTNYKVIVDPRDGNFDPLVYVKEDCDAGACVTGTVLNGPGVAETLTFMVPGGTRAFLIVDGEFLGGASGDYDLTVSVLP